MTNSHNFFSIIKKRIQGLTSFALSLGMGWVIVMMFLTTFDVAARYFFSKPISGAIEISEFMLAVFGILGMAYTHSSGSNVKVTMLINVLSPKFARFAEIITSILSFQIILMLAWYGFLSGIEEFYIGTTTDTLKIPVYPLYFLTFAGASLLCLEILINLIESIKGLLDDSKKY